MEQKDYASLLPNKPPDGLIPWLREEKQLDRNFLIYKIEWGFNPWKQKKERMAKFVCSACQEEFFAIRSKSESIGTDVFFYVETGENIENCCPYCESKGEYVHTRDVWKSCNHVSCFPVTIEKVEDNIVLCCWYVVEVFSENGTSVVNAYPYEAYLVEKKRIVRLKGWKGSLNYNKGRFTGRWEQLKGFKDYLGVVDLVYPWNPDILTGTAVEHCKLDLFMEQCKASNPILYLRLFQKYPTVEHLIKEGAGQLLESLLTDTSPRCGNNAFGLKSIHWDDKSPFLMLGLNKTEFREMVKENWDAETLYIYKLLKKQGYSISAQQLQEFCKKLGSRAIEDLVLQGDNPIKILNYLAKQYRKDNRSDYRILRDYWRMAEIVGLNLANPDVRFPSKLISAHDRVMIGVREVKIRIDKERMEKVSRFLAIFAWKKDGIFIRAAQSAEELKIEGEKLHHCVSCYAKKMERGETSIFFIRRVDEPDVPWYTLELDVDNLEVKQNGGKYNGATTEEVQEFETAWLEHIRALSKAEITENVEKRGVA